MFTQNLGLPQNLKVQRFCFARIGIDITNEAHIVTNYFWNLCPTVASFTLCFAMLNYAGKHISDVDEVTDALSPVWQIMLSLLKWMTFMYKRREMVRLVNRIWAWNLEANEAERALLVIENKKDIRFCSFYLMMVTITGSLVVIKPFIAGTTNFLLHGEFYLEPPIKATYPLDIEQDLYYLICLIWIAFAIYNVIYSSVGVDSLFAWITNNVIAQFNILKLKYNLVALENGGNAQKESIIDCIEYHRRIIDIVEELNRVFGTVIFVKFTVSCLQVCVLAFQLSRIKQFGDAAFHANFLLSVALQLIIYCRNGQYIKDESSDVANNIYTSFQWQHVNVESRKLLLMSMMRARRISSLSGIFFVVDLGLYLWVFRTAGSYIALLFTMAGK